MEYDEFEKFEVTDFSVSSTESPALHNIKSKFLHLARSTKCRKIAISSAILIILFAVVFGIISHNSPSGIAERYVKAYIFQDAITLNQLCAYDYYALQLYEYDHDEESFFEAVSDEIDEEITSWKDYSKYMKKYITEYLSDEYGEYKITLEATRVKNKSIKKFEEENTSLLKKIEKRTNFDRDGISAIKEVTVKTKIQGEEKTDRETVTIYLVKIGFSWKVLYTE